MNDQQSILLESLLKNLETYFPISQLHVDLQKDYSITNEADAENTNLKRLESSYNELVKLGIQREVILKMEPFCNSRKFIEEKGKKN
jgi:hypothetical protein